MTKFFISCVYEDHAFRDQVCDWATKGLLGMVIPVIESEDVRQRGVGAIDAHLRPLLRSADVLLVLVGQDTHDRRWVDREIEYCISASKRIVAARLPNTTGAAPPGLRARELLLFSPQSLRAALGGPGQGA